MTVAFDTLTAAEAMESAGVKPDHARAIASQLHAAAGAVEAVTRTEVEAMLAALKSALLDRIAESERAQDERSAKTERGFLERSAELERGLLDRIGQSEVAQSERSAELERGLLDRISQSERRMTALLWRLFGAMVAVATVSVAVLRYLA